MKKGGALGAIKHMLKDIKKDFKLEFPAISLHNYDPIVFLQNSVRMIMLKIAL